jgi:hypothetical protein
MEFTVLVGAQTGACPKAKSANSANLVPTDNSRSGIALDPGSRSHCKLAGNVRNNICKKVGLTARPHMYAGARPEFESSNSAPGMQVTVSTTDPAPDPSNRHF